MANEHSLDLLRPYQRDGVEFLMDRRAALLADEMGLGKTVQTSVAIGLLRDAGLVGRTLIVTPTALSVNWYRELGKWCPQVARRIVIGSKEDRLATYMLPVPVLLASYQQVRLDIQEIRQLGLRWDLVILDEAQWIKNRHSETHLSCTLLPRERSWALSATPLENRTDDLGAVLRFAVGREVPLGASRVQLRTVMESSFLRRRKKDVLGELPPIIDQDLPLALLPRQRAAYEHVELEARGIGRGPSGTASMLAMITRMKQVCNADPETMESCKLEALLGIVQSLDTPAARVVVFSQYVETLRHLSEQLPIPSRVYHGSLQSQERDDLLQWFKATNGPSALLVSFRAGGVGLNIPEASHVILYDRWWNPAVEQQAIERAHRFGRDRVLHVLRFWCADTIEERILEILREKADLFRDVVDPEHDPFPASVLARLLPD